MLKSLKQIGLKEKEIKAYLSVLENGYLTAQAIASATGIKRTTVYLVLEKLIKIGLVGEIIEKNKKAFFAEKPEKLLKIIQEKKKEMEKEETRIREFLPRLEKILKNKKTAPDEEIRHYQESEGAWNIAEDMLKNRKDFYVISPGKIYDYLGLSRFLSDITKKRRQSGGTKAFMITDYHPQNLKFFREEDTDFREMRFLPEIKDSNSAMILYADKIALVSLAKPYSSILIKNTEIFSLIKFVFDSLWKELKGENIPNLTK